MPYKSKSQMRAFFAKEERGELPKGTAERWAHHTKDIKALPEKVKKASLIADLVLRKMAQTPISATTAAPKANPVPAAMTSVAPPSPQDVAYNPQQKAAAATSGGPAPTQMRGPAAPPQQPQLNPNQLQNNLSSGSSMGLQTAPPPAGPGVGNAVPAKPPTITASLPQIPKVPNLAKKTAADPFVDPRGTLGDEAATPEEIQAALWRHYQREKSAKKERPLYGVKTSSFSEDVLSGLRQLATLKTAEDRIPGGNAAGRSDSDFSEKELSRAEEVEKEHSPDIATRREVGKDHLAENGKYYTRWLDPMEKVMKAHPAASLSDFLQGKAASWRKSALDAEELLGQGEQRKQEIHDQQRRFEEEKHQMDLQKQQLELQQMQQEFDLKQQQAQAEMQAKQQEMQLKQQTAQSTAQAKLQEAQAKMQAAQGPQGPPPDPQQQYRQNIMASQGNSEGQPQ